MFKKSEMNNIMFSETQLMISLDPVQDFSIFKAGKSVGSLSAIWAPRYYHNIYFLGINIILARKMRNSAK